MKPSKSISTVSSTGIASNLQKNADKSTARTAKPPNPTKLVPNYRQTAILAIIRLLNGPVVE